MRLTVEALRDSSVSWPIRRLLLEERAKDEGHLIARSSESLGYEPISHSSGALGKRFQPNEDVFILGSGASVLDLEAHQWAEIREGLTIGFGPWPLHHFVPDIYAFSPSRDLGDYRRVFSEVLAREDIVRKRPRILLLRPKDSREYLEYRTLPAPHKGNAYLYGRVNTISRSFSELVREISFWHRRNEFGKFGVALDSGATLARLISMGLAFGARRIVLVGVDLGTPDYFFQADRSFLVSNGFKSFNTGQKGKFHDTLFRTNRPVGIAESIAAYRAVSESIGTRIEVMSPNSALASVIPVYSGPSKVIPQAD